MDGQTATPKRTLWDVLRELTHGHGGPVKYADAVRRASLAAVTFEAALRQLVKAHRATITRGVIHVVIPPHERAATPPPKSTGESEATRQRRKERERAKREAAAAAKAKPLPRRRVRPELGECRCRGCHGIKMEPEFHMLWRKGQLHRDRLCKACRERVQFAPGTVVKLL